MICLVLGGEKSGKTDHALGLAAEAPGPRLMLATGEARDQGFRRRILEHRRGRPADMAVREAREDLPEALEEAAGRYGTVVVDSLDFWLFAAGVGAADRLAATLARLREPGRDGCRIILVSCEVGLGPVAADAATRAFVRDLGALNRAAAGAADQVVLVVAGLPLTLKGA